MLTATAIRWLFGPIVRKEPDISAPRPTNALAECGYKHIVFRGWKLSVVDEDASGSTIYSSKPRVLIRVEVLGRRRVKMMDKMLRLLKDEVQTVWAPLVALPLYTHTYLFTCRPCSIACVVDTVTRFGGKIFLPAFDSV